MAKQTGRAYAVKSTSRKVLRRTPSLRAVSRYFLAAAALSALGACATTWINPTKSVDEARGENPMQLVDRMQTENTYERDFESCMRAKGYSQD